MPPDHLIDLTGLDDAELVAAACAPAGPTGPGTGPAGPDGHAAYGELVRRYSAVAIRTAAFLGAGPDAEDVAQEAFVKAYRSLGRFRPGSSFRPWLLTIVTNEAHNRHRSARRRGLRERAPTFAVPPADPEELAEVAEAQRRVRAALADLPAGLREVLVCRFLLDLNERETAQVLRLAPGTVKSRTSRGLRKLRTVLDPVPAGEEADHGR